MKTITVVRHGKANTGATDAESYDLLSDMGKEQAALVGAYLKGTGKYKRAICGTLRRHIETVEFADMGLPVTQDARLNEFPFFELGQAVERDFGLPFPQDDQAFEPFFTKQMEIWEDYAGRLGIPGRAALTQGVIDVLHEIDAETVVISSGGIIGLLGAAALDLTPAATTKFVIPVAHTSIHRFRVMPDRILLEKYCSIPHLDRADQRHLVTFA
ncbi:MAG: histidine phosphatase family protein [Pseudomonadota bacterium]